MPPHVAEVLRDGDPGLERGLSRGDRHVGGVGDDHGSLRQRAARPRIRERRQLAEQPRHLVAALAATHEDDHVGVRPPAQLVLEHRLSRAEAAGHSGGAAAEDRKERVEHALPRDERRSRLEPATAGPRRPDRPCLPHRERGLAPVGQRDAGDRLSDRSRPFRRDRRDPSGEAGRDEDAMLERRRFRNTPERGPRRHRVSRRDRRTENPEPAFVERRGAHPSVEEVAPARREALQRTEQPVEDLAEKPRAQLRDERTPRRLDRVPRREPCRLLVDLQRGDAPVQSNDLADEPAVADEDHLAEDEGLLDRRPRDRSGDVRQPGARRIIHARRGRSAPTATPTRIASTALRAYCRRRISRRPSAPGTRSRPAARRTLRGGPRACRSAPPGG